jgi:hypothetical protein
VEGEKRIHNVEKTAIKALRIRWPNRLWNLETIEFSEAEAWRAWNEWHGGPGEEGYR